MDLFTYSSFAKQILMRVCVFSVIVLSTGNLLGQGFVDITQLDGMEIIHDGHDPNVEGGDFATGSAWIDFNNDNYLDLYITMRTGANYLFKNLGPNNNGDIEWDEVAASVGVQDAFNDGAGVVVGDFNNDGFDDLYLANASEDVLFRNNGNGTFTDITAGSGLIATGDSKANSASWGDYDNDGFIDLFVSHHWPYPGSNNSVTQDYLFHNNSGNGTFTNVSSLLGIDDLEGLGFIAGWLDYDNDMDMDIILINDCFAGNQPPDNTPTKIFRNDSHLSSHWALWVFEEVSASIGVDDCRNGMGIAIGDLDRNGWLDFAYTNVGDCALYQNDGDGTFTDISLTAGINGQHPFHFSWGTAFFDYDLDGWQDLYFVLGSYADSGNNEPQPNELYHNNGNNTFTDMAASLNMNDSDKSRSGIIGDYDNDGDLDVFLVNYGEQCILKENTNNNGNNWAQFKLIGQISNINGVGARLKLTDGNNVIQYYEIRSGSNLGGGDDMRAYFGLGSATSITELEITWPSGIVQTETSIGINQLIGIVENGPLPVELFDFIANPVDEAVLLNWSTASETENDYFTIQRSSDGRSFENLGKVQGNGTTTEIFSYNFIDENPIQGDNYYRLRQTGFNGASGFSEIKLIRFESKKPQVSILPNPVFGGEVTLRYQGRDKDLLVEFFDMMGKLVYQSDLQNNGYLLESIINVSEFNNGLYFLRVSGKTNQETLKFVVNH